MPATMVGNIHSNHGTGDELELRPHEGYEWLYVLSGRLRLVLGEHELVLTAGEAAQFDTRPPHAFGNDRRHPVEIISLFGRQGERVHVGARPQSLSRPQPSS